MAELLAEKMETILVVDDSDVIVEVVATMLNSADFHVLQADSGIDALKVAANFHGRIALLLSDVRMRGMSGPELGQALKLSRPDIQVMFMSAFSGADHLVLNYSWAFIQKPFTPVKLVEIISSVLHWPDESQGSRQDVTESPTE